jgi:ZIP family zinc transporter
MLFANYFRIQSPIIQALIAGLFTWFLTLLGSLFVYLPFKPSQKIRDGMLGFAAGVMIAASYWSLLEPSIEISSKMNITKWVPPGLGFLIGAFFIFLLDKILPHLHIGFDIKNSEGIKTNLKSTTLLIFAITLHNIPEGMAVGVSFGALKNAISSVKLTGAISLAVGIAIQNIPEGIAVSMPLSAGGLSKFKSFFYGQASAIVEPLFSLIGAYFVTSFQPLLPYALAFAAGAMIFVVIEEVIPESQNYGNTDIATISAIAGFILMMVLDVALG